MLEMQQILTRGLRENFISKPATKTQPQINTNEHRYKIAGKLHCRYLTFPYRRSSALICGAFLPHAIETYAARRVFGVHGKQSWFALSAFVDHIRASRRKLASGRQIQEA